MLAAITAPPAPQDPGISNTPTTPVTYPSSDRKSPRRKRASCEVRALFELTGFLEGRTAKLPHVAGKSDCGQFACAFSVAPSMHRQ